MDLTKAHVLITGGSEGIGLGLAARFLAAGSKVLITGRSAEKVEKAAQAYPGLQTCVNDIGQPAQREALSRHIQAVMPELNILVNNAGIQRRIALATDHSPWAERQAEIDILFSAPVHLNHLLLPIILAHSQPSLLVNVTSGGAYIPQAFAPVYSACKAALHHYTITLRHALAGTTCRVAELIPPAVQTTLAGAGHGAPLDDFCDTVFPKLSDDSITEVGYGPTENLQITLNGKSQADLFAASAVRFPVVTYTAR
ncbi:uncharacterized oxidoreductase [Chitinophaga rupis]|uniref:Uncharacterized oxidoreductase n=1 Tax=Chitinophaga rupis TaxID=573321 RepID=A0A1H7PD88_9BACT|nr:SDR family NAD(P)-dependent oxidoreductase [Chitinophaga rupis]SEL33245.1 uncharacterized oxidoreductase [Chitinophaga rupis]